MPCCTHSLLDKETTHEGLPFAISRCGLLMLIDRLLLEKKPRQLKMAEGLLRNFHRTQIAVNPPNHEAALAFVNQMISKAETMLQNSMPCPDDMEPYATRLLEAAKEWHQNPTAHSLFQIFANCWNEFTTRYLKTKLNELTRHCP